MCRRMVEGQTKCYVCDKVMRNDNLNRHMKSHVDVLFTSAPEFFLKNCLKAKNPVICKYDNNDVQIAFCLHCGKGNYKGLRNHTPAGFNLNHNKDGCYKHFGQYEMLYKEQLNLRFAEKVIVPVKQVDTDTLTQINILKKSLKTKDTMIFQLQNQVAIEQDNHRRTLQQIAEQVKPFIPYLKQNDNTVEQEILQLKDTLKNQLDKINRFLCSIKIGDEEEEEEEEEESEA